MQKNFKNQNWFAKVNVAQEGVFPVFFITTEEEFAQRLELTEKFFRQN
jgi:hypothetical protein